MNLKLKLLMLIFTMSSAFFLSTALALGKYSQQNTFAGQVEKIKLSQAESFLSSNAKNPSVVTLPSGLQYKILVQGTGKQPKPNSIVTVHYAGQFLNGNVFDSSWARGKPLKISLEQMIVGWQQALLKMREGSVWMLYIPSELAYGERGIPGRICPNELLVFKVHLISVDHSS